MQAHQRPLVAFLAKRHGGEPLALLDFVRVARAGDYEVRLRRWPPEADLPLAAPNGGDSRALPVAGAKLSAAGQEAAAPAPGGAREVAFRVKLPAGDAQLQGWFTDAAGNDLCGAYYATVRRLP